MDDQDHRAIAARMDLWHQQEEAAGMVFWHPRGHVGRSRDGDAA